MKRKLVLKTEKLRVLTATRLDRVVGGAAKFSDQCVSAYDFSCVSIMSQASICDGWGSKG